MSYDFAFPAISLVLGVYLIVAGDSTDGWILIFIGVFMEALYLVLRYLGKRDY